MTVRPGAFDSLLSVQERGHYDWTVIAPLIWEGTKGDQYVVPVGFITDFATVPRFMQWKVSPYGPYTRAAVLHDWLLRLLRYWLMLDRLRRSGREIVPENAPADVRAALFETDGQLLAAPPVTSRDLDGIFRRAMEDLGVRWDRRWVMWAAVRWGALFSPYRSVGRGFARDLPRVLLVSLLMIPTTTPGVVGVLISLTFEKIANLLHLIFASRKRGEPAEKI